MTIDEFIKDEKKREILIGILDNPVFQMALDALEHSYISLGIEIDCSKFPCKDMDDMLKAVALSSASKAGALDAIARLRGLPLMAVENPNSVKNKLSKLPDAYDHLKKQFDENTGRPLGRRKIQPTPK